MAGRVIVVQASSSEDESMQSPVIDVDTSTKTCQVADAPSVNKDNKIHRYDREDMLKLYNEPSAKIRPPILSPEFDMVVENGEAGNGDGSNHKLWSPELWIQRIWNNPESRQNATTQGGHGWTNRRQGDHDGPSMGKKKPIDRLKTENEDGIVLSPQRRSFGAGCQVASSSVSGGANAHGSHAGGGGGTTGTAGVRRSASPVNAGGDDRQQPLSQHTGPRASFRSRGGISTVGPVPQQQQTQNQNPGGYGRGDRNENWRDRTAFSSSSFGRGNVGRDVPASVTMYSRSRGNMNSWNTGGNRRSYGGGGGGYHGDSDALPEWVTEGPSDMFETMELHGFDEEDNEQEQAELVNSFGNNSIGQKAAGPARIQQYRFSTGSVDVQSGKEITAQRTGGRAQKPKRDSKSPSMEPPQNKPVNEKNMVKMSAEALVDGFDIGDMAQFLTAAAPDFDSMKNGEFPLQNKPGNALGQVPPTPGAASRFSKFFASNTQGSGRLKNILDGKNSDGEQMLQQQSLNIMDLLSKAAGVGDAKVVHGALGPAGISLPEGAKSLDEIEASYKASTSTQRKGNENSSNKVLQELFQSARSTNVPLGAVESDLGKLEKDGVHLAEATAQQQTGELPKALQDMANSGGSVMVKGNPLADPAQQQQFLEALHKIHVQQQQIRSAVPRRRPGPATSAEAMNPLLAAYSQLPGFHHLLQQQQQAAQMGNFQVALNSTGRAPSPLGVLAGVPSVPPPVAGTSGSGQPINPAFSGFLPPANVPPPPITQHDLFIAQSQSIYQRAVMNRKFQDVDEQAQPPQKPQQATAGAGNLPTAFLPTSVIKQLHGSGSTAKPSKDGGDEASASARPIVKQQHPFQVHPQEQTGPNSVNDQMLRNLQQQAAAKSMPAMMAGNVNQPQAVAPPQSMTPQDLQRLIDQTHLQQRQQRQHQERLLAEQIAKAQQQQQQPPLMPPPQQFGANPAATAMNPTAVTAALALQNNPVFLQMLRAQAMQAQQMAMFQQQAAAAAGSGMPQVPSQPIPASATVSAVPTAAQMIRGRLPVHQTPTPAAPNAELLRQLQQQQHHQQQMFLNQLRQQAPTEANLFLNRLLTGQAAQQPQHMHAIPGLPPTLGVHQFPAQAVADTKPMALEELERMHKQAAAMQQP